MAVEDLCVTGKQRENSMVGLVTVDDSPQAGHVVVCSSKPPKNL
jgi:hypothetical protein